MHQFRGFCRNPCFLNLLDTLFLLTALRRSLIHRGSVQCCFLAEKFTNWWYCISSGSVKRHPIICSNSLLHDSSCSAKLNLCIALVEEFSSSLSRKAILFSRSCSLSVVLHFLAAAKLRDFSRTLSLIISQGRAGFIDSSFLYSSCVCAIVCFIRSYSQWLAAAGKIH